MTYEEARRILHPDTAREALAEIEYYGGFSGAEAKIRAFNEACLVACEALNTCNGRPCLIHNKSMGVRNGIFRGFCDNNDKAVIELEDGELHKVYVYYIQFLDVSCSGEDAY